MLHVCHIHHQQQALDNQICAFPAASCGELKEQGQHQHLQLSLDSIHQCAAALAAKLLPFCRSLSGWGRRQLKGISHTSWACTGCYAPVTQNGDNSAQPQQALKVSLLLGLCSLESTRKANTQKASLISPASISHQEPCFPFAPRSYTATPKKSKPKHQQTKIKGRPKRRCKELVVGVSLRDCPYATHDTSQGLAQSTGSLEGWTGLLPAPSTTAEGGK